MSQTKIRKAVSKLRHEVGPRRRFSNPEGPEGRLLKMRQTVTALIKHERIELNYYLGDESRGYAERLISDAIRYGEKHKETMEMASYWLIEHQLVHKLFKVLVPRYQDCKFSYTKMWKAPRNYPNTHKEKCVLELRNNIFPQLVQNIHSNNFLLHNLLLDEARKEYEKEQHSLQAKVKKETSKTTEFVNWEEWPEVKEMEELENQKYDSKDDDDSDKEDFTRDTKNNMPDYNEQKKPT